MRYLFLAAALIAGPTVHAAETITFTYDELGRLVRSGTAGGPKPGVVTTYTYDPAGNRAKVQVTGAGTGSPTCSFAISDATVDARSGNPLEFIVARTGSCGGNVSLSYATQDGSALEPTHYTAASGTITFTTSESVKAIFVPTKVIHSPISLYLSTLIAVVGGSASVSRNQGLGELMAE